MSYATEAELDAYAAARDITLTGIPSVLLTKAMDYLILQNFTGTPVDPLQDFHYPTVEAGTPERVKTAQIVLAIMYDSGQDPLAAIERAVKSETVDVISVEYMDNAASRTLYPQLTALLAPLLVNGGGGSNFAVVRG